MADIKFPGNIETVRGTDDELIHTSTNGPEWKIDKQNSKLAKARDKAADAMLKQYEAERKAAELATRKAEAYARAAKYEQYLKTDAGRSSIIPPEIWDELADKNIRTANIRRLAMSPAARRDQQRHRNRLFNSRVWDVYSHEQEYLSQQNAYKPSYGQGVSRTTDEIRAERLADARAAFAEKTDYEKMLDFYSHEQEYLSQQNAYKPSYGQGTSQTYDELRASRLEDARAAFSEKTDYEKMLDFKEAGLLGKVGMIGTKTLSKAFLPLVAITKLLVKGFKAAADAATRYSKASIDTGLLSSYGTSSQYTMSNVEKSNIYDKINDYKRSRSNLLAVLNLYHDMSPVERQALADVYEDILKAMTDKAIDTINQAGISASALQNVEEAAAEIALTAMHQLYPEVDDKLLKVSDEYQATYQTALKAIASGGNIEGTGYSSTGWEGWAFNNLGYMPGVNYSPTAIADARSKYLAEQQRIFAETGDMEKVNQFIADSMKQTRILEHMDGSLYAFDEVIKVDAFSNADTIQEATGELMWGIQDATDQATQNARNAEDKLDNIRDYSQMTVEEIKQLQLTEVEQAAAILQAVDASLLDKVQANKVLFGPTGEALDKYYEDQYGTSDAKTALDNFISNKMFSSSDIKTGIENDLPSPFSWFGGHGGGHTFASGGIATAPTLGLIAEAGSNEAIIPLNSEGIGVLSKALEQAGANASVSVTVNLDGINIADNDRQWDEVGRRIGSIIQNNLRRTGSM